MLLTIQSLLLWLLEQLIHIGDLLIKQVTAHTCACPVPSVRFWLSAFVNQTRKLFNHLFGDFYLLAVNLISLGL